MPTKCENGYMSNDRAKANEPQTTSTLLFLLQKSLNTAGAPLKSRNPPPTTSIYGRMTQLRELCLVLRVWF
ncbi:hypothetical protein ACHQM5_030233 [Ranunculus cassubicifolius]